MESCSVVKPNNLILSYLRKISRETQQSYLIIGGRYRFLFVVFVITVKTGMTLFGV